jgi:hypothetical protein
MGRSRCDTLVARLPIVLVFLALVAMFGLVLTARLSTSVRVRLVAVGGQPLRGMQQVTRPEFSLERLMSGVYQKDVEASLNRRLPFRAAIVRATNQLYYSAFSKSYMYLGNLVVGRDQQWYERAYLDRYCNPLRKEFDRGEFDRWRAGIEALATFFEQRGQAFVYLITPSKAAYFPEKIPTAFGCVPDPPRPDYKLAVESLQASTLHYVDASRLIVEAKGRYPVDLFPRGGTHFTDLGAAMVSRVLVFEMSRTSRVALPDLRYSYVVARSPEGTDVDLLETANLMWPDRQYDVPKIVVEKGAVVGGRRLKLAIVGGSFLWQIMDILGASEIFGQIDYFYYFKLGHHRFPRTMLPDVDENDPRTYGDLFAADIVLLEENEANIQSSHVRLLRSKLLGTAE